MNATATWYNAERVSQPGSTILSAWKAEREAARAGQSPQASVPVSSITRGTEMFDILTGGFGMMGAVFRSPSRQRCACPLCMPVSA